MDTRNENTAHHRDHNLHREDYKALLTEAIKKGLISFRNKDRVVIDFKDKEDTNYSVLVEVTDIIKVVSVYYNKKHHDKNNFITCLQRIKLSYVLDLTAQLKETIFIVPKLKIKKGVSTSNGKLRKILKVEKPKKVENKLENIELSDEEKQLFLRNFK